MSIKNSLVVLKTLFIVCLLGMNCSLSAQMNDADKVKSGELESDLLKVYLKAGRNIYLPDSLDRAPVYPGCGTSGLNLKDMDNCSNRKFLTKFYKTLRYPAIAREKGVQGTVIASFILDSLGQMKDAQILEDIGKDCGRAVMDVLLGFSNQQEPWVPGYKDGVPVNVLYIMPVKFKLE